MHSQVYNITKVALDRSVNIHSNSTITYVQINEQNPKYNSIIEQSRLNRDILSNTITINGVLNFKFLLIRAIQNNLSNTNDQGILKNIKHES